MFSLLIESEMSASGMGNFYNDLGVNLSNCESMLSAYILKIYTYSRITEKEFDNAMKGYKSVGDLGKSVR
jgi:hypothetical protein